MTHPPLSPRKLYILSLTALVAFTIWSALVFDSAFLPAFDDRVAHGFYEWNQTHHDLDNVMVFFTFWANPSTFVVLSLVPIGYWILARRDRKFIVGWVLLLIGCGIINWASKELLNRDRPPAVIRHPYVSETNESYPSGHTMGSTAVYGMMGLALVKLMKRRRYQALILTVTALWVAAIGFSRIYLRAHWFSDVVGGGLLGLAYLWFFLAMIRSRGWLRLWPFRKLAVHR